jgi:hypothetical protein
MLRPMLKDWLDQNLPGIVDEHVKREIGPDHGAAALAWSLAVQPCFATPRV